MADLVGEQLVQRTAAAHDLAAHQVQRLDTVGAFVDLGDAYITHQLLLAPLANIAMTAEHLLAMHCRLQAEIGEESLGYRSQQGDEVFGAFTGGCLFAELGGVQLHGDVGREGTTAFVQRLHGQQHAPNVGVHDDRVSDLVLGLRAGR
ncbi:hypothetical protein D9M71_636540 [compost metagenome]